MDSAMITNQQFEEMQRRVSPKANSEPVDREKDLHEFIFSDARHRGWIVLHGAMSERTARTPGEFDFILIADRGRTFFIECKARYGKLSPEQLAMKVHAEILGHKPAVVRSPEEYLEVVNPTPRPETVGQD
jgi:hypothetical protein